MSTETIGKRTRPPIPGDREYACVRAVEIAAGMHP